MVETQELNDPVVTMFDLRSHPQGRSERIQNIERYIDNVTAALGNLDTAEPDAYVFDDITAILIGDSTKVDRRTVSSLMKSVIRFVADSADSGLEVATSICRASTDHVVIPGASGDVDGQLILADDTIRRAFQIVDFCEPGEIMIGPEMELFLKELELDDQYKFESNGEMFLRDSRLRTYSFCPADSKEILKEKTGALYHPSRNPSHDYKKYRYFPSIDTELLDFLSENELNREFKGVVKDTYESIKNISESKSFLSHRRIMDVLGQFRHDPEDTVYVLSRMDRPDNFWTQKRKDHYINRLKAEVRRHGSLNQIRVRIYKHGRYMDDYDDNDISQQLREFHTGETYRICPSDVLGRYEKLDELLFGFTVSTKHNYAIIPIPAPEEEWLRGNVPNLDEIGETMQHFDRETVEDTPMKAIITNDEDYVGDLIGEMEDLIEHESEPFPGPDENGGSDDDLFLPGDDY